MIRCQTPNSVKGIATRISANRSTGAAVSCTRINSLELNVRDACDRDSTLSVLAAVSDTVMKTGT
jgi:hypothetical protein